MSLGLEERTKVFRKKFLETSNEIIGNQEAEITFLSILQDLGYELSENGVYVGKISGEEDDILVTKDIVTSTPGFSYLNSDSEVFQRDYKDYLEARDKANIGPFALGVSGGMTTGLIVGMLGLMGAIMYGYNIEAVENATYIVLGGTTTLGIFGGLLLGNHISSSARKKVNDFQDLYMNKTFLGKSALDNALIII